ncbi:hypothetical protein NPIL_35361 [Nephila pilipes]|uniref:Uncharacterized protein n=1 Tax=Nephila pilipes TaxID=299642 RepID=A0A8X6Q298_NEPPI|nr:hypothetical protein NPIL_35361 [Nephila pilipes]
MKREDAKQRLTKCGCGDRYRTSPSSGLTFCSLEVVSHDWNVPEVTPGNDEAAVINKHKGEINLIGSNVQRIWMATHSQPRCPSKDIFLIFFVLLYLWDAVQFLEVGHTSIQKVEVHNHLPKFELLSIIQQNFRTGFKRIRLTMVTCEHFELVILAMGIY